jgi:hypothetical protein
LISLLALLSLQYNYHPLNALNPYSNFCVPELLFPLNRK